MNPSSAYIEQVHDIQASFQKAKKVIGEIQEVSDLVAHLLTDAVGNEVTGIQYVAQLGNIGNQDEFEEHIQKCRRMIDFVATLDHATPQILDIDRLYRQYLQDHGLLSADEAGTNNNIQVVLDMIERYH